MQSNAGMRRHRGFLSMGAHLHGAVWMAFVLAAAALITKSAGWNPWLTLPAAFLPAFLLGHWIGEGTFALQSRIKDRLVERGEGDRSQGS